MKIKEAYDWQCKACYIRVPESLLAQMPEQAHLQTVMIQRNVAEEICVVMEAIKPGRKEDDPDKIRLPKMLVQGMKGHV